MTQFLFDELLPIFHGEIKEVFIRFVDKNIKKSPYIFSIVPRSFESTYEGKSITSFSIEACGNTEYNFKKGGYSLSNNDGLYYYYCSEEWDGKSHSFTSKDFPKTDAVIMDYCVKNKDSITEGEVKIVDGVYCGDLRFTKEFLKFQVELFDFLIDSMVHLRENVFFVSAYNGKMLLNVEFPNYDGEEEEEGMEGYYTADKNIEVFERLNDKEDVKQYRKFILGN